MATINVPQKEAGQYQLFQEEFVVSPKWFPIRVKLSVSYFVFLLKCKPLYLNSLVPKSDVVTQLKCILFHPMKVLTMK